MKFRREDPEMQAQRMGERVGVAGKGKRDIIIGILRRHLFIKNLSRLFGL
ncbi:MAG: hypothetical protein MPEBLZ_01387 [Candidatus Methanoperedens nitroreducens]|uniref:Uncharacterized protein n=1 Tax=Candidatus Methanoperedens nitratireducens TaxID=1392998 RepID=A0A0N8KR62_9EURY|nr:MAG: hypothetical protein MPEBLZ_01387 [Candidatus Methanoperedens sp. BLZ1]